METTEKKSNGALLGSIIVIIILLVGGIYVWQANIKNELKEREMQAQIEKAYSDALDSLEGDINETNTEIEIDLNTLN